jgi:hypothetical protein
MFLTKIFSNSGIPLIIEYRMILHKSPGVCCYIFFLMSTCPRCGTGNFKEGQSLSIHLSRYCSGPTLLCNTLTGLLPSKRSTEQMHLESSQTTFHQQIRMFDSNAFAPYLKKNGVNISVIGSIDSIPQLISYLLHIKYPLTEPPFL